GRAADNDRSNDCGERSYEDQNSSSVSWSPWNSRNFTAFPFSTCQTWISGDDQDCPLRSAETVARTMTRSPSARIWSAFHSKRPAGELHGLGEKADDLVV